MRYFKYRDEESPIGDGTRYIETDEGWSVREVTFVNGTYLGSNVKYPLWGLCLSDAHFDYEELLADEPSEFEIQEISKLDFEQVWTEHLAQNEKSWRAAKSAFPVGTQVRGRITIFYPQGAIVDLGDSVLGVANYEACKVSTGNDSLSTQHFISAVVAHFDEQNQWLVLDEPKVERKK